MKVRNVIEDDYYKVIDVINDWWGGREMTHLLPRLFFDHFQQSSFVVEEDNNELAAFLIGFVSQTHPDEGYIHFIGVNPELRNRGIARELYRQFFQTVRNLGCEKVKCITSPVNESSVSFHKSLGFSVSLGRDYAGLGQDRILFSKFIGS
ncbi:GNAT family N-acetyltransferase [Oceanobacillus chungangensis]|uniref:GNAT family N-acetyltransferase n=1 Tax=Oceanobacillus chungangensis TaxID=1229152 RepID=A0A3D8PPV3_9BACI|nr:GNAT family N-acetyltransferase [Oceanobacillus chungangensis]RDW17288.1 GNAT family N-acetyltransferase [Oceanobacillus chungangensis]